MNPISSNFLCPEARRLIDEVREAQDDPILNRDYAPREKEEATLKNSREALNPQTRNHFPAGSQLLPAHRETKIERDDNGNLRIIHTIREPIYTIFDFEP